MPSKEKISLIFKVSDSKRASSSRKKGDGELPHISLGVATSFLERLAETTRPQFFLRLVAGSYSLFRRVSMLASWR